MTYTSNDIVKKDIIEDYITNKHRLGLHAFDVANMKKVKRLHAPPFSNHIDCVLLTSRQLNPNLLILNTSKTAFACPG